MPWNGTNILQKLLQASILICGAAVLGKSFGSLSLSLSAGTKWFHVDVSIIVVGVAERRRVRGAEDCAVEHEQNTRRNLALRVSQTLKMLSAFVSIAKCDSYVPLCLVTQGSQAILSITIRPKNIEDFQSVRTRAQPADSYSPSSSISIFSQHIANLKEQHKNKCFPGNSKS